MATAATSTPRAGVCPCLCAMPSSPLFRRNYVCFVKAMDGIWLSACHHLSDSAALLCGYLATWLLATSLPCCCAAVQPCCLASLQPRGSACGALARAQIPTTAATTAAPSCSGAHTSKPCVRRRCGVGTGAWAAARVGEPEAPPPRNSRRRSGLPFLRFHTPFYFGCDAMLTPD